MGQYEKIAPFDTLKLRRLYPDNFKGFTADLLDEDGLLWYQCEARSSNKPFALKKDLKELIFSLVSHRLVDLTILACGLDGFSTELTDLFAFVSVPNLNVDFAIAITAEHAERFG